MDINFVRWHVVHVDSVKPKSVSSSDLEFKCVFAHWDNRTSPRYVAVHREHEKKSNPEDMKNIQFA